MYTALLKQCVTSFRLIVYGPVIQILVPVHGFYAYTVGIKDAPGRRSSHQYSENFSATKGSLKEVGIIVRLRRIMVYAVKWAWSVIP